MELFESLYVPGENPVCTPGMLGGMPIVGSMAMTEEGEPYEVPRTWKERLFTRPWKPLKATRTVIPQVPMRIAYRTQYAVIMHPEMAKAMIKNIAS